MPVQERPSPLLRWLFRLPVHLYHWGLGGLMGQRMLLLQHVGAKTGLPRETVVEVVRHDAERDVYTVVSGYGTRSAWFHNLVAHPAIRIQVGARTLEVNARLMSAEEGGDLMVEYAQRNPFAARQLMTRLLGHEAPRGPDDYRQLGATALKFFALEPRAQATSQATASHGAAP